VHAFFYIFNLTKNHSDQTRKFCSNGGRIFIFSQVWKVNCKTLFLSSAYLPPTYTLYNPPMILVLVNHKTFTEKDWYSNIVINELSVKVPVYKI